MTPGPEMKVEPIDLAPEKADRFLVVTPPQISIDPETGRIDRTIVEYVDGQNETIPVAKVVTEPRKTVVELEGERATEGDGFWVGGFFGQQLLHEKLARHAIIRAEAAAGSGAMVFEWVVQLDPRQIQRRTRWMEAQVATAVFKHLGIMPSQPGSGTGRKRNLFMISRRPKKVSTLESVTAYLASGEPAV